MQEKQNIHKMLPRLTSLRSFAALFVFTYHMQLFGVAFTNKLPFKIGYSGVSFFFILSGFVLTWGGKEGKSKSTFYRRRFARIYPSYATVLITALIFPFPSVPVHSPHTTILTFLLLQSWSLHNDVLIYAVNPPSWSLSCEAFFYMGLPLYKDILARIKDAQLIVIGIMAFIIMAALAFHGSRPNTNWSQIVFTYPLPRLAEFLIGVIAAIELKKGHRIPQIVLFAVAVAGLGAAIATNNTFPIPDVALDPVWLSLIIACSQLDLKGKKGFLNHKVLVYAGEVSFAFYLIHQFTLLHLAARLGDGIRTALLALFAATLGAIAIHHAIELPFQRLILSNRNSAQQTETSR